MDQNEAQGKSVSVGLFDKADVAFIDDTILNWGQNEAQE